MGWTIFTVIDLWMGLFLLDMMATTVPPEKLPRLRAARKVVLALLAVSIVVFVAQIARAMAGSDTKRALGSGCY